MLHTVDVTASVYCETHFYLSIHTHLLHPLLLNIFRAHNNNNNDRHSLHGILCKINLLKRIVFILMENRLSMNKNIYANERVNLNGCHFPFTSFIVRYTFPVSGPNYPSFQLWNDDFNAVWWHFHKNLISSGMTVLTLNFSVVKMFPFRKSQFPVKRLANLIN